MLWCVLFLIVHVEFVIHTCDQSSFGFGQVGGTAMVIHPRYLFAALDPAHYEAYKHRNRVRALQSYKAMSDMMIKNSLVKVKNHPPYHSEMERKVLLNSMARATFDPKTGEFSFKDKLTSAAPLDIANVKTVSTILSSNSFGYNNALVGVGVDQGESVITKFMCGSKLRFYPCRTHLLRSVV